MKTNLAKAKPIQLAPKQASYELALIDGDLGRLSPVERLSYYQHLCQSLGLNPLTKPFNYLRFRDGGLQLYTTKACTDQLRKIHGVTVQIVAKDRIDDVYVVTARATLSTGREDEDSGAVTIGHLKGDALANAIMKATTKAKRRVTLSICGLSMLDESELDTVRGARAIDIDAETAAPARNGKQTNGVTLDDLESQLTQSVKALEAAPQETQATEVELEPGSYDEPDPDDLALFDRETGEIDDDDIVLQFGKHKGSRLSQVPSGYLEWLRGRLEQDIRDPEKQNYRARNLRMLTAATKRLEHAQ